MPGWTFVGVKPSEKGQAREKDRVDRREGETQGRRDGRECVRGKFEVD